MKRSEAIRHIINVLRLTGNHYCDNGRDKTDANKILERLEIIGMLPPLHIFEDQHESYCATYDNDECTCNPFRDNIWEPEDEKK